LDNGPGITQDQLKRVFEPFYTTRSSENGAGLGLFVSYMIVTSIHKGVMEVESTAGEGTCFLIKLPLLSV